MVGKWDFEDEVRRPVPPGVYPGVRCKSQKDGRRISLAIGPMRSGAVRPNAGELADGQLSFVPGRGALLRPPSFPATSVENGTI
jgi:hypothetical protein